jgi:hypothetical protein
MKVKLLKDLPGVSAETYGRYDETDTLWDFGHGNEYAEPYMRKYPDFFQPIEEPKFKVGDWAWDENELLPKKAVDEKVEYSQHEHYIEYINADPQRFKRLATEEEIKIVTDKEGVINCGYRTSASVQDIIITHDALIFRNNLPLTEIPISELRRIIEIADKLLIR